VLLRSNGAVDVGRHRLVITLVGDASARTAPKSLMLRDETRKFRVAGVSPVAAYASPENLEIRTALGVDAHFSRGRESVPRLTARSALRARVARPHSAWCLLRFS
jgi:hypothetical protein